VNDTAFFPFPHVFRGERKDGTLRSWPSTCLSCRDRPCEQAPVGPVQLCSYGVNFQRLTTDLLVAGIVLRDWTYSTPAYRKRLRENSPVARSDFEAVVSAFRRITAERQAVLDDRRASLEEAVLDEELFKTDYLKNLRAEVEKGLSFFHDYDRINVQIIQNINTLIETRYQGNSSEEKRDRATRPEKAIYEAARFLQEKLEFARFLLRPERLATAECVRFSVHGMILKYIRIYQSWFDAKRVTIRVTGQSYREIIADPRASSVIPHALIDNALKYAPSASEVEIYIQDVDEGVEFEIESLGPRIEPKEMPKIFRPFFRGGAAERIEEGAGYGLYLSQLVAREHLGTKIKAEQKTEPSHTGGFHLTTFSILYPNRAKGCAG